jgi:hypothetical protein
MKNHLLKYLVHPLEIGDGFHGYSGIAQASEISLTKKNQTFFLQPRKGEC